MITLKKYLDSPLIGSEYLASPEEETILPALLAAYGSALLEMGDCSVVAIPALGDDLKRSLARLQVRLSVDMNRKAVRATDQSVQEWLREWGKRAALHYPNFRSCGDKSFICSAGIVKSSLQIRALDRGRKFQTEPLKQDGLVFGGPAHAALADRDAGARG